MQMLLDHIAAVVISGIIILVLAVVTLGGKSSSIESTQYRAQKRMLLNLVEFLERDITNIGAGVSPVTGAIQSFDTSATIRFFQFLARPDSSQAAPSVIRYEWEPEATIDLKRGTVPTYTVRRLIDGTMDGRSTGNITSFRVDLLTADSTTVGAFSDTRLVRLDVTAISPIGVTQEIQESRWTKMFRPVNFLRTN